jgi:hypothetical protein
MNLATWIADLGARARALSRYKPLLVSPSPSAAAVQFWVGGMFAPESFITATRQYSAQVLHCKMSRIKHINSSNLQSIC